MIILMHDKHFDAFVEGTTLQRFFVEAGIPTDTQLVFDHTLPEEDEEGHPIFAFKVSAKEIHYWRGEPIKLPEGTKL